MSEPLPLCWSQENRLRGPATYLCDFRSPPGDTECLECIWSQGRSCRVCYREDCYRRGWDKRRVDRDNAELVREKRGE